MVENALARRSRPRARSTGLFGAYLRDWSWTCFGSFFDHFLEHFWSPFWDPFWDQIGPKGGKMSPRGSSGASKNQKAAFSKTLKDLQFFSVFGSRGFPREPQEAREGSQKTPKEIQRWSKTWSKSGQKVNPKLSKKKRLMGAKISLRPGWLVRFFRPWGYLKTRTKTLTWRCQR